jgi:hypothetical protein
VTIRHAAHWNIIELHDEAIMVYCPEAEEQRTHIAAQLVGTGLVSPSQACSGLQVEHESLQAALHAIGPELRQAVRLRACEFITRHGLSTPTGTGHAPFAPHRWCIFEAIRHAGGYFHKL